jgi:chaperonin GroES
MSIHPIRDQIIVRKQDAATQTASGLYVPTTVEEKISTGTILEVGSGRVSLSGVTVPLEVKAGQRIKFNKSMATEVTDKGETVLVIREDAILCTLD